jgi:WXG100 family type VII secretion target
MSDGMIYCNYNNVENVEEALTDATAQVNAVLDRLQAAISPLTATWAGVSETEYQQVQARWTNDVEHMTAVLAQYNGTLGNMKWNTFSTDQNLAFQWQNIG